MGTASIIELYILFSITTAIVGLIQIFSPVYKKLKKSNVNNEIVVFPVWSGLIFAVIGFVTSPILFAALMAPSVTSRFIDSMYDSLASPD